MSQHSLNLTCYRVVVTDPKGVMKSFVTKQFSYSPQEAIDKAMEDMYVKFMVRRLGSVDVRIDLHENVNVNA